MKKNNKVLIALNLPTLADSLKSAYTKRKEKERIEKDIEDYAPEPEEEPSDSDASKIPSKEAEIEKEANNAVHEESAIIELPKPDVGQGIMATFNSMRKRQRENAEKAATSKNAHVTAETVMSDYEAEDDVEDEVEIPKRFRGGTRMDKVHSRPFEKRVVVDMNNRYQLVSDNDNVVSELSNFLGKIAKRCVPLTYCNHVSEDLVIENPNNKLACWVQEKRVLADLNRNNLNSEVPFNYLPIIEAPQVSEININLPISYQPPVFLTSTVTMASVTMTKQMPTQVTKPKSSKFKSKKPTSSVSQKIPVVQTTTTLEGSVQGSEYGEGRGENQISPKDKDIHHPLRSDFLSRDMFHSNHPLIIPTTLLMNISHPLNVTAQLDISKSITSAYDLVVVQSLLGLREGSELSERSGCFQEKGEENSENMHAIFSSMEKESERSPNLDGESEGVRVVSQGEPLIQEQRDNERKTGTGDTRVAVTTRMPKRLLCGSQGRAPVPSVSSSSEVVVSDQRWSVELLY
ncbi:hypothetical protein AgCh_018211 [Apium graveolens]